MDIFILRDPEYTLKQGNIKLVTVPCSGSLKSLFGDSQLLGGP